MWLELCPTPTHYGGKTQNDFLKNNKLYCQTNKKLKIKFLTFKKLKKVISGII